MVNLLFLRKIKLFNKNKYSRNRQYAGQIFYFSLCINLIVINLVFFSFYSLSFSSDLDLLFSIIETFIIFLFILVNCMFTFFFGHFYKTLKSGLLLDFFFKKFFIYFIKYIFLITTIVFSEKFFIEYNYYNFKNFLNFINKYFNLLKNETVYAILSVTCFFAIFLVIIIFNG